ncbi:hypothetical protein [Halorhodospira halophila]|uniref:Uncharacterized protein n=1 Tax=Halorhodospira halophila (strain DSM 244 / SL1) TaxID=349124 RepID=A1WZG1_HALHL|nr:hypothetical protein [Halorhodospira halophila]ABM63073.1 hypothetical protein Hhal_2310 [Halorhodospira halophila SL1]MBK1727805.1 hypothetical protein [Halorhodospira halophila]
MAWSWFKPLVYDNSVLEAAQLLQISEYDFLALAHWRRFKRIARREDLDRLFGLYMRDQDCTPPWARELAREIIARADEGTLDPRDYGVRAPVPKLDDLFRMLRDVFIILLFMTLFALGLWLGTPAL